MVKILYVDDHLVRDPLSLMLELRGYEVATARNGAECIQLAHSWGPDIILMDLRMPRMDGLEAIQLLREDPNIAYIPIFILSAWTTSKHREHAFTAGANEFFAKPVDLDRLLTTVSRYLSEKDIFSTSSNSATDLQTSESVIPALNLKSIPYIAGPPIIDPKMFFGREQTLQKMINMLHNNNIMIIGPRRIGKTSLLHQIKNRLMTLDDSYYFFIPIFVDVQGTPEPTFFHTVMDEIAVMLTEYLPVSVMPTLNFNPAISAYNNRNFGKDLGKIIKALRQSHPNEIVKLVLLMDEMDVMNTYDQRVQSQLRSIFQKDFAHNLGIVVAGVNLLQEWERYESPFYNMFTLLQLEPLTPEQARELVTKPVEGIYTYDEVAIQRILAATDGYPFRLQQLCLDITQRIIEGKQRRITLANVEFALANIQWIEGTSQVDNQTIPQRAPVDPPILAEKRASYHASISTPTEGKSE